MAKRNKKIFVGTIDAFEALRKVRKPAVRPVQKHRNKKAYRRKPKHPQSEE
jgi:hypothetical protein